MSVDGALKAFDRLEDKYIKLEKKYKRLREKNKAETRELEKARGALLEIIATAENEDCIPLLFKKVRMEALAKQALEG